MPRTTASEGTLQVSERLQLGTNGSIRQPLTLRALAPFRKSQAELRSGQFRVPLVKPLLLRRERQIEDESATTHDATH